MSSLVGRLARTLSQGPEEAPQRRGAGMAGVGAAGPPHASPRLSASPSFNDFSLSVREDAEEEYKSVFAGPGGTKALDQPQGAQCNELTGSRTIEGMLLPKDAAAAAAAAAAHVPIRSKAKSVKVMGMDAYDYCDLLRSGSL